MSARKNWLTYQFIVLLGLAQYSFQEECSEKSYDKLYATNNDDGTRTYSDGYLYSKECTNFTGKSYEGQDLYDSSLKITKSNYTELKSEYFKTFRRIYYLIMCENVIPSINSNTFKNLPSLSFLNLSDNAIERLSNGAFSNLVDLATIDLSRNKIKTIENDSFSGLSNLLEIYLYNNELTDMSPVFDSCEKLNFADVSNNKIEILKIPNNCSQLTFLYVHHNKIQKFSGEIYGNASLISLDISYNNLNDISGDSFKHLTKLKAFNLSGNVLFEVRDVPVDLFKNTPELITLNLSFTGMKNINSDIFSSIPKLKVLDLSRNKLQTLPVGTFRNIPSLEGMYLNENPIFENIDVPLDFFHDTSKLITLNLSSTGIRNIKPGTFSQLHQLETLDLSWNKLKSLSDRLFHDIATLRKLYINGNQLTYIHFDALPVLTLLNLNDNSWDCNTLFTITKGLRGVEIIRGNSYKTSNFFGIRCTGNIDDSADQLPIFSTNSSGALSNPFFKDIKQGFADISRRQSVLQDQNVKLQEKLEKEQNITGNLQKNIEQALLDNNSTLNSLNSGLIVLSCIVLVTIGAVALWILIKHKLSRNSSITPEEYNNFSTL